ncbi:Mov34/MPN/PAD-1 family protein [Aeromonas veronii]|uniref:Mov34/MPN/PAD-1 family protein n=1 Tax=Aeromonas veronii TaxID=654 RepID=UPI00191DDE8A|nr:Mov34/MPN/PAD-1 family protein [Aeromonas veronii]MBL0492945.1 Mov34/MPN/PAD-1 family protein [Aeromonas veronii]
MKLVFRVTSKQRLIITSQAVEQLLAYVQKRCWQREAGGVLLGRHLLDSEDVVVDEVTSPQSSDRRARFSFFRSKKHEHIARERWLEEMNTLAYLGLWHTHPEDSPTPSPVDREDWQQAVANDTFDGERLFFPIVGRKEIRVWTKSRSGGIRELKRETK